MRIRSAVIALPMAMVACSAFAQTGDTGIGESADAYHLLYWLPTGHLANYTEWWYFNVYDSSNHVQAIFSYLMSDPLNLPGGLFPLGIAEMGAVAYTPNGIVNEMDPYLTPSFSARYTAADVNIGSQNAITVLDADHYQISGATRDGRISWNLAYERQAPAWYAGNRVNVAANPWQLMSWLIDMPRAQVSGTLTVDGATYPVSASGYHDHNWGEWNLNGVPWNWAQYSQPAFTFDLGDFPDKPGGAASIDWNGRRYVFNHDQYTLVHTQWAFDPVNNLSYPTQSVFQASNGDATIDITMNAIQSDPLTIPMPPPKAVIYEQTVNYSGQAWVNGQTIAIAGNGFKEYTAIAQ